MTITRELDIGFMFRVTIDGRDYGEFQSIAQMDRKIEPFLYKEGGRNWSPHTLIGQTSYGQLVLRWGLMDRQALWDWAHSVEVGQNFRRDGEIHMLDRQYNIVRVIGFERAWPIEWKGAELSSMNSQIPVEELKLVVDTLTMEVR